MGRKSSFKKDNPVKTNLFLTEEEFDAVKAQAAKEIRSFSAQVTKIVQKAIKSPSSVSIQAGGFFVSFMLSDIHFDDGMPYDFEVEDVFLYMSKNDNVQVVDSDKEAFKDCFKNVILERIEDVNHTLIEIDEVGFDFTFSKNSFECVISGSDKPLSRELCDAILSVEPVETIFEVIGKLI